jgi:hypothetical protein
VTHPGVSNEDACAVVGPQRDTNILFLHAIPVCEQPVPALRQYLDALTLSVDKEDLGLTMVGSVDRGNRVIFRVKTPAPGQGLNFPRPSPRGRR